MTKNLHVCSRCLYDETFPGIHFDDLGVCNYCKLHDELEAQYPAGEAGKPHLDRMVSEIREAGRGRKYDCIVGVSGGCDSSFLLAKTVELGLRPLAVHFDNTWNTPLATQNIYNVTTKLGVDLHTHVVDNREIDDIYRAFLLAQVNEIDVATDMALVATTCAAAERHGIRYILDGHSFRTEGVSPLGMLYTDGKYLQSVHKAHGTRPLKTLPQLTFWNFVRWSALRGIRRMRPLYHLDYHKEKTKAMLADTLGWQWYGGHHLENRIAAFYHTYITSLRGQDTRLLGHAALVRSGQLDRDEGLRQIGRPIEIDANIVEMVVRRLGFRDEAEMRELLLRPRRPYTDFKTYKPLFEQLRAFFWLLYRMDRVPKTFYVKYCLKRIEDRPDEGKN